MTSYSKSTFVPLRAVAIAISTLLLSACGGGGGSDNYGSSILNSDGISQQSASPSLSNGGQILSAKGISNNGPSTITLANTGNGTLPGPVAGGDGWTQCAVENELCFVPGPMQVRFGVPGHYTYRIISDAINCTFAEFSDPAVGSFKACSYAPLSNGRADQPVFARYSSGNVLSVGPGREYAMPCDALKIAKDGDTVEIDASGTYQNNTCAFGASDLTIRGINGRPKISTDGNHYSWGKGIWIPYGYYTTIENVELTGAKVPDRNGAAIRQDGKHLVVRNSYIHRNENGILTNNDRDSTLVIENTEFAHNGHGDGRSHNVYAGYIASLVFRGSYSHDANIGHNLKSRAMVNNIFFNRFSSTEGGRPSYELEFPNAGTAYVVGNVIQQPAQNDNTNILAFGAEGANNPGQSLYVVNNTFINDGSGQFLMVNNSVKNKPLVQNNVFVGQGKIIDADAILKDNYQAITGEFISRSTYDLRPAAGAGFIGKGTDPGISDTGVRLTPKFEYNHVAGMKPRATASDLGAYAKP